MSTPGDRRPIEERLERALVQTAERVVPDRDVPPRLTDVTRTGVGHARWAWPLLAAAAVVLVVASTSLAIALLRSDKAPRPGQSRPTPAPTITSPTVAPPPPPAPKNLRNATIDIPAWANSFAKQCPAGVHHFVNDVAPAGKVDGFQFQYHLWIPPEQRYAQYGTPVYGDLDGKPGDEVLVELSCDGQGSVHPVVLLALSGSTHGTLHALGVVNASKDDYLSFVPASVRVSGHTVLLDEMGPEVSNGAPLAMQQTRGYNYENGKFVQVSGPTSFPPLPTDVHDIDPRNTTLYLMEPGSCQTCAPPFVATHDGHGTATTAVQRTDGSYRVTTYEYTVDKAGYMTMRSGRPDIALATVTRTTQGSPALQAVYAVTAPADDQLAPAWPIVWTGTDGVLGIVSASGSHGVATITVRTAAGNETRTYQQDPSQQQWSRTS